MVQITIDLDLSSDEETEISAILGCETANLADEIKKCSTAATL